MKKKNLKTFEFELEKKLLFVSIFKHITFSQKKKNK